MNPFVCCFINESGRGSLRFKLFNRNNVNSNKYVFSYNVEIYTQLRLYYDFICYCAFNRDKLYKTSKF